MHFNFTSPKDIVFKKGGLAALGKKAVPLGMKKPLVVCDPSMDKLGYTAKIDEILKQSGLTCTFFNDCRENPAELDVAKAAALYSSERCDGLVALGGGSTMDLGKGVRILAKHGGSILDYDVTKGGIKKILPGLPPMIALPTTAGSGSEATLGTVIIDPIHRIKVLIYSPHLSVDTVILDPELTMSVPPSVTAATGMDALVHALEAFTAPGYNPLSDGLCRTSIELIGRSLSRAVEHGDDFAARGDMMIAALSAGMAFANKGLGAVHALSHQLSSYFHIPHGTANAIMLPHVLLFNAEAAGDKYIQAAGWLGLEVGTTEQFSQHLIDMAAAFGLPTNLRDAGVDPDKFQQMASDAHRDAALGGNPVKCDPSQLLGLYQKAL